MFPDLVIFWGGVPATRGVWIRDEDNEVQSVTEYVSTEHLNLVSFGALGLQNPLVLLHTMARTRKKVLKLFNLNFRVTPGPTPPLPQEKCQLTNLGPATDLFHSACPSSAQEMMALEGGTAAPQAGRPQPV